MKRKCSSCTLRLLLRNWKRNWKLLRGQKYSRITYFFTCNVELNDNVSILINCFRAVDPHGLSRGRKLSVGPRGSTSGDHGLDALAEGPEEDHDSDSETDTLSTSPRVRIPTITFELRTEISRPKT